MEDGHPVRLPEQQTLGLELCFEEKKLLCKFVFFTGKYIKMLHLGQDKLPGSMGDLIFHDYVCIHTFKGV